MEYFEATFLCEGKAARRLTLEEGLGDEEWNVYIEEPNAETNDFEQIDIGSFDSYDEAEKSFEEQCELLEEQGFVLLCSARKWRTQHSMQ